MLSPRGAVDPRQHPRRRAPHRRHAGAPRGDPRARRPRSGLVSSARPQPVRRRLASDPHPAPRAGAPQAGGRHPRARAAPLRRGGERRRGRVGVDPARPVRRDRGGPGGRRLRRDHPLRASPPRLPLAAHGPSTPRRASRAARDDGHRTRPRRADELLSMAPRVIRSDDGETLVIGGLAASHVDREDPTRLDFPYMRRIADVLDVAAPAGQALAVLHLGAGLGALARYVEATRPGSSSHLVDIDPAVARLADRPVEVADARDALARRPKRSFDIVVGDVFDGPRTPRHLSTFEFATEVRRVLRPGGVFVANLIDDPPHRHARRAIATLLSSFPETLLLAERQVLSGRRTGNLVVAAATRTLPVAKLRKRSQDVLDREAVEVWCEGAKPLRD